MRFGTSITLTIATTLASLATLPGSAAAQDDVALVRYVQTGSEGAKVRNVVGRGGLVLRELPAGRVLAVYGENGSWLEVEVPGGLPVWVFGEFLRPTATQGIYEVTGKYVNQRPRPSSDPSSYPLRQKLYSGDRVEFIQRDDPSKPFAQDWVQVWSPHGVRAWVGSEETRPLPDGASGETLWSQAVLAAKDTRRTGAAGAAAAAAAGAAREAAATTPPAPTVEEQEAALEALGRAEELYAREQGQSPPDYASVKTAYQRVLDLAPSGLVADKANERLLEVSARAEAHALQTEIEERRRNHEQNLEERWRAIEAAAAQVDDPYADRFDARGWIERIELEDGSQVWGLRWSGEFTTELEVSSRRYDLAVYEGFEVGIRGRKLPITTLPEAGFIDSAAVYDVNRIEVLSGRERR